MSLDIQPVLVFADGAPVSSLNPLPTTGGGGGGTVDQGAANGDAAKGWSSRLTDGAAFIVPAKTGQFPAALGATTAASSLAVGIATDQLSTLATAAKQDAGNILLGAGLPAALVGGKLDINLGTSSITLPVSVAPGNSVSAANSSTTPLAGAGTFTGSGVDVLAHAGVEVFAFSDVAGTLYLEYSTDNTNWDLSLSFSLTAGIPLHIPNGAEARYYRTRYVNGGSAQAVFRLQTLLLGTLPAPHTTALSAVPLAGSDAILTQSEMVGLSSSGGGTYVPVKVSPSGAVQVGGDVGVANWIGSTAPSVGQKAMTASLPVAIASNQSTVPVAQPSATKAVISTSTTILVSAVSGHIYKIFWAAGVGSTIAVYDDGTGGTANQFVSKLTSTDGEVDFGPLGATLISGLTVVTTGGTPAFVTVVYR